jgi:hypothetical protein
MRRELVAGFVARNLCLSLSLSAWKRIRSATLKTPKIKLNLPPVGSGSTGSRRRVHMRSFFFSLRKNNLPFERTMKWRWHWMRNSTTYTNERTNDWVTSPKQREMSWIGKIDSVCERERCSQRHSRTLLHQTTQGPSTDLFLFPMS